MNKYYLGLEDDCFTHNAILFLCEFNDLEENVKTFLQHIVLGLEIDFMERYKFTSDFQYNTIYIIETELNLEQVKDFIKEREFDFDLELVLKSVGKLTKVWG